MRVEAFKSTGPGKFDNRADERVYRMSLDGCGEIAGDVSEMGEVATKVDGPILGLARAGAIVTEDEYGFVGVEYFDSTEDLAARWAEIEKAVAAFYAEAEAD